ncbi:hypothetical protein Taro_007142 [Colocasia esculenta]|uniref:Uncharacterized protein n=1 Tax=Colocasia esculenta TaxID=4460 RepID=A0A843TXB9_COLES|nr:hypothetical protein [Colocasia esculenta]
MEIYIQDRSLEDNIGRTLKLFKSSDRILRAKNFIPSHGLVLIAYLCGVIPFDCEGRPGGLSRVLFSSVVKEELVGHPGVIKLKKLSTTAGRVRRRREEPHHLNLPTKGCLLNLQSTH